MAALNSVLWSRGIIIKAINYLQNYNGKCFAQYTRDMENKQDK